MLLPRAHSPGLLVLLHFLVIRDLRSSSHGRCSRRNQILQELEDRGSTAGVPLGERERLPAARCVSADTVTAA